MIVTRVVAVGLLAIVQWTHGSLRLKAKKARTWPGLANWIQGLHLLVHLGSSSNKSLNAAKRDNVVNIVAVN